MKNIMGPVTAFYLGLILVTAFPIESSAAKLTELVNSCNDCHGAAGASRDPEFPIIGGLSAQYTIDSFAAYKDKTRPCEQVKYPSGPRLGELSDMCKAVDKLTQEEIKQFADYYAAQPFVSAVQAFDKSLIKRGEDVHNLQCVKCHENAGSSAEDDSGILAGQWMRYMEQQFDDYAAGKRQMPAKMKQKMDKLSAEDIKALIHYYGSFQGLAVQ
jgi:sulfide dehydrogenase cytochrome subunit